MTLQDPSFLLREPPATLLERPVEDVRAVLWGEAPLQDRHLRAMDHVLRHHVLRLLVQRAPPAELEAAEDTIRRLWPSRRAADVAAWAPRWLAWADLLGSRRAVLREQDPARVRRLAHAAELLALVAREPGLSQVAIGERLALKAANLSRILNLLEANDLLVRREVGREKRVYPLADAAPALPARGTFARLLCPA